MGNCNLLIKEKQETQGKLSLLLKEYQHLVEKIASASVNRAKELPALLKRMGELEPVVKLHRERQQVLSRLAECQLLLKTEQDPEIRKLVVEEIADLTRQQEQLQENLQSYLFPGDPSNEKNAIVEIRQGTGGEEACLFARDLFRMYSHYCQRHGFEIEIFDSHISERGGFKEIVFLVKGRGAYGRLRYESGVHRVQRVPETESSGRIHTSAATVAVFPEAQEEEVLLDPKDLKIDTFCSSGAGGQHVNKTASAVRITHLPSGIVVSCQDERSQLQNRSRALKILRARLRQLNEEERKRRLDSERKAQVKTGDRSEKIRTYNFPQNRLTDHRLGVTFYQLERILDGELDELISRCQKAEVV